jgi:hypothetical protein
MIGIRIYGVIGFIDPEYSIKWLFPCIGDIMGVPYGHIHIGRLVAI